jgi:glycosyltransferase involved in cell wall biosynthesis
MTPGISIIVCCYNSASRLPETIKHLALQQVPSGIPWEVIIIDNASTDDTKQIAQNEWDKFELSYPKFTVTDQLTPGLSAAREKGIEQAAYEYLLFCDDDNWLYPNYVSASYHIMNADLQIGAIGGCGIIEAEQPASITDEELKKLAVNGYQDWAETHHWVYGAGAVYRKSILMKLQKQGWHQISSDRKGKKLLGGGDVEICFMIYLKGYKIIASDKLLFKHFVPLKRQQNTKVSDTSFWDAYTNVLLNSYYPILNNDKRSIEEIINKWVVSSTIKLTKSILSFHYNKIKTLGSNNINLKKAFSYNYGTWRALLKNRKKIIDHNKHIRQLLISQS